jgi:nuclear factor related to kappa-B-binding protein
MSAEQLTMAEDSDSDASEATANSTNESNFDESLGADIEVAKILDQKFHLPKDLCEHSEIFREFFSLETWSSLTDTERSTLSSLLPKFPENNEQEREETIQQLFANKLTRFSQTPLDVFHNNLQDGNYRPDIAHYRKSILKAEEREQHIRQCERMSELAEKLVSSREKLLRSAYRCPAGSFPQLPQSCASVPRLSSSSASMRANRRYFQEISKLGEELGLPLSDEETVPEGMNMQLTKKQIKLLTEPVSSQCKVSNVSLCFDHPQGSLSPGAEMRIVGTTSTKEKSWDHLTSSTITDERYKQMLQSYKKRKMIEPVSSPFIASNDVFSIFLF